ncbi:MAG: ABC transporter substrate-binding protein, partial [Candidatus Thorarchaeota archaeon]
NYESFGSWIFDNVYETLFTYPWDSSDATPDEPLLATGLSISPDGLNYTYTLRQGVAFHDGTPFNASCVKYNIERALAIFDSLGPAWMIAEPILGGLAVEDAVYGYGMGSSQHVSAYNTWLTQNAIEVLSTYEVRIRLEYPYVPFNAVLSFSVAAMISPTYIENHGGVSIGQIDSWMIDHTCGTGPYMVTTWIPDDRIELARNTNYWRESIAVTQFPDAGSIDTITILTNEDSNSRMLNIKSGLSDGCSWPISYASDVFNGATGESGDGTLKSSNPDLKVWAGEPTFSNLAPAFSMHPLIRQSGSLVQNPFTLMDMREAVAYSFDYNALIDAVYSGLAIRGEGPMPVGMWGHHDNLPLRDYNLSEAVTSWNLAMVNGLDAILADSGYDLEIYYPAGYMMYEAASLLIKDGLEAILADGGATQPSSPLTIDLVALEYASYAAMRSARELPIYITGWIPDYADPDNYIYGFVYSRGVFPNLIGLGESTGWDNITVDGWISSARAEANPSTRLTLYENIQEAIVAHCAYIWAAQPVNFHVERTEMHGYVFHPMRNVYFFHYYKTASTYPSTTSTTTTSTTSTTTTTSNGGPAVPIWDTPLGTMMIIGGGGVAAIAILAIAFRMRRRGDKGFRAGTDYKYPPDDGSAVAVEKAPLPYAEAAAAAVSAKPPPPERSGLVEALRGGNIVGGRFEFKVKVKNGTDFVINNVTVTLVAYPEDCMKIQGDTMKRLSRIEPDGFRSPQFTFTPTKDCVEGHILATVSYIDHQNKIRTVDVEPYTIRSVCDLLTPLESSMEQFELILTDMECTSEEQQLDWNPQILFDKALTLLPSKNFYIVDKKSDVMAGEFIGSIRGFAEGKYTGNKVAIRVRISGPIEGNQARLVIEGLGEDGAMLPTTIDELAKGIESWICMNCGGALDPNEVSRIKGHDAVQCKYCGRTLTLDLFRK